jgi:hypothetical protein
MQAKTTMMAMFLTFMIPISSFSMVETTYKAGLAAGTFVAITILIVVAYVLSKIVTNKEIKK